MNPELSDPGHDDVGACARLLLLFAGLASVGLAALACFQPPLTLPWPLPPLHAACFGALQAASALPWLLASRERDSAALRIPFAQMLTASGVGVLLVLLRSEPLITLRTSTWIWLTMHGLLAAGAAIWLVRRSDIQAPAERPDRALLAAGVAVGTVAVLLAFDAAAVAKVWPWPLGPEPASLYSGGLAGWAVALVMSARERRRSARRSALWGLVALGCLVTLASAWHRGAFHHAAAGGAWVALFMTLSILAGRRLTRLGVARRRAWIRPARPSDR